MTFPNLGLHNIAEPTIRARIAQIDADIALLDARRAILRRLETGYRDLLFITPTTPLNAKGEATKARWAKARAEGRNHL